MMKIDKIITSELRNIRNIKRYSSSSVHHSENVAEHSYWVCYYSLLIAEELETQGVSIDFKKLLSKAILHDLPEGLTGDIIHTFKHHNDKIRHEVNETEKIIFKETLLSEFDTKTAEKIFDLSIHAKDDFEGKIISLADALCVFVYCYDEIQMGNLTVEPILRQSFEKFQSKDYTIELLEYKKQIEDFVQSLLQKIKT